MFVTAKKVIHDDYCIVMDGTYWDSEVKSRCKAYFKQLYEEQKIRSRYEDDIWKTFNGVNPHGINFQIDKKKYLEHGIRYILMDYKSVIDAVKMYAIWCMGEYDFRGIQRRIRNVKRVLETVGDKKLCLEEGDIATIKEFLDFVAISVKNKNSIMGRIKTINRDRPKPRSLKPMVIYAAVADKTKAIMQYGEREEKLKYFPVYMLTNLGFRIPLRATEWTLTPYEFLEKTEEGYFFTVRRTILKKGGRKVQNDVDGDYKLFTYNIPYTEDIQIIEWYINETKGHERKFLFDFDETSLADNLRKRFSLESLNRLIAEFVEEYMVDSSEYNWLLKMTGVEEFEPFTAGDMRPIALVNLYHSGASLDVCMELADHDNMETTYHYIRNVEGLIETACYMKMHNRIKDERNDIEGFSKQKYVSAPDRPLGCDSHKIFCGDTSDCDKRCLDDGSCVLCSHYNATEQEVDEYIESKKKKLEEEIKEFQKSLRKMSGNTFDIALLQFQKASESYADACEMMAQREYERWKKLKGGI